MEKHARLEAPSHAWRLILSRLQANAPALLARIIDALRIGRRLLALSQPETWRFALLPIVVAVSVLIAASTPISWGLVASEALAVVCALSGRAILRAYKPVPQGDVPYLGAGVSLLVGAALATLSLLANASAPILTLSALAFALIAFDLAPTSLRDRLPRGAQLIAHRVVAPILLGVGLVMVTALAQRARPNLTLWMLGIALSLLAFAVIQARAMVAASGSHNKQAPWRRPLIPLAGSLALAAALTIAAALPISAPHGMLLAVGALPMGLVAVTGFWRSTYLPARALAARSLGSVFTIVTLALTAGALASALVTAASVALTQALGI